MTCYATVGLALRRACALGVGALALLAVSACGSASYEEPIVYQAPVTASVAVATVTLSTEQQTQVNSATASIQAGNFDGAIVTLNSVAGQLTTTSPVVQNAMGQAYAGAASASPQALAQVAGQTVAQGGQTVTQGVGAGLINLAAGSPFDAGANERFAAGAAAMDLLVPSGASASSLSTANQTQVGVVALVHSLRVMSFVGDGEVSNAGNAAAVDAKIAQNYSEARQAQISRAATLVSQTKAPLTAELTRLSKDAAEAVVMTRVVDRLSAAAADGVVTAAELKAFQVELFAR